ncbi:unnamed protein product [Didymodactylos carnosus]|uniref:Protein NATD1 n=1 Tax=Didymodactylos carnosus TaxID=1234261 RepID=A0A8S2GJT3_9BILA|nr:unnamed protein product [Didymodactylos carnosus]CAF3526796.1 unnamed protein product [Didymodactylos carnosus]
MRFGIYIHLKEGEQKNMSYNKLADEQINVVHNPNAKEFEVKLSDSSAEKAYLSYELVGNTIDLQHTYVPNQYRGKGVAQKLVESALDYIQNTPSIQHILPSCSYVAKHLQAKAPQYSHMTTIRLKIPPNLYSPWKYLYKQRSKKAMDPPAPLTPFEQKLYDHYKVIYDTQFQSLKQIFSKEVQLLSTKSRFAQLQLRAEEREFRHLLKLVQSENDRLLDVRLEDERLELEEEMKIKNQVISVLGTRAEQKLADIEAEVKRMKLESKSHINPNDLDLEIERMLNEKHDYDYSINLQGTKKLKGGQTIDEQQQMFDGRKLIKDAPYELEPKQVERKAPGSSKYE